jgi:integrase
LRERGERGQGNPKRVFNFDYGWIRGWWDRLRVRMGMEEDPNFVPHILRPTCASRLVQKGVHLQVVKEWMGHKAIQTTLRYAHLAPKQLHDAVKLLDQAA